jgi:exopolyphosphatase / guanosine-5'-triphosphate,3'-diphosphate pyrophosphatase
MTIVPRWEWRIFGPAERLFDSLEPDSVAESDELYVLSHASDASVKVRDELMDVKRLLAVDDEGLEQWTPVLKAPFPLRAEDIRFILDTLREPVPPLKRDAYPRDEIAAELAGSGMLALNVHKRRERFTIAGCKAERTELRIASGSTHTIAVESEDPERVSGVVRELGLSGRRVTCMARGLKALAGFRGPRYAVIDVGTNSVKLHVGEQGADGAFRRIHDRADTTRLGEGLERTGRLGRAPVERTVDAIAVMAADARSHAAEAIAAVGTAGLRIAPNAADLIDAVRDRTGIDVEVISAEEEARVAYLAAVAGLGLDGSAAVVFDTGGGSSQFTFGDGERFSVDVGAVSITEHYGLDGAVSEDTVADALRGIAAGLVRLEGRPDPGAIVGMGGAVTNLAAVKHGLETYDPDVVQGTLLERGEIDRQIELYRTSTAEERRRIVGLQPNRAEVILAGACIVHSVLDLLGRDALTASDRGLRHGVLIDRFGPSTDRRRET